MPITFAPASPFNARAFADAAGGQVTDRRDAIAAQRQAQAAQQYAQASIASAQNETRAADTAAELDARRIQQQFQIDYARQAQLREIQAQQQQQARAQQFEMAKMNVAITKQEQDEQTRRINGLATIQRQKQEGILTPEQAGDAEYELLTGINAFQRRYQYQQSRAMEEQAAMRNREVADYQKSAANAEQFMLDMALKGITVRPFINPETGRQSFIAYDQKTGRLYNPLLEHAGKGTEQPAAMGGEWGHLGTKEGQPDEAKILKDAKSYAEGQLPVLKGEDGKDKNAAARADLITRRVDGIRREMREAKPVTSPQADKTEQTATPPAADTMARSLDQIRVTAAEKLKDDPYAQQAFDEAYNRLAKVTADPRFKPPYPPDLAAEYNSARTALKTMYDQLR